MYTFEYFYVDSIVFIQSSCSIRFSPIIELSIFRDVHKIFSIYMIYF